MTNRFISIIIINILLIHKEIFVAILRLLPMLYEDMVGNIMNELMTSAYIPLTKFDWTINSAEKDTTSD